MLSCAISLSTSTAHRLVDRCYAARQFTTLDEIVWGGIISELSDLVFYEHLPTLRKHRNALANGSNEIHRAYLSHNFRPKFDNIESDWYTQLQEALDFLELFPFEDAEPAIEEYERRKLEIRGLASQSSPPAHLSDEMIYHFIMREATEIVTQIYLSPAVVDMRRLIPDGFYWYFPPMAPNWIDRIPDPGEGLVWARKALRSIVEDGRMPITWQVTRHHYNLSLH